MKHIVKAHALSRDHIERGLDIRHLKIEEAGMSGGPGNAEDS